MPFVGKVLFLDGPFRNNSPLKLPGLSVSRKFEKIDIWNTCPSQEFGSARNHWQKVSDHIFATNFVARYL